MENKNNKKVILVTGCTGFVGSTFILHYKKKYKNAEIIGISTATAKKAYTGLPCTFYKGSITDQLFLESIFNKHKITHVVHLAGNSKVSFTNDNPTESAKVHILGVLSLLEQSEKYNVQRFVNASSVAVYDSIKKMPLREDMKLSPDKNFYSIQKVAAEQFCRTFSQRSFMDTISLRFFQMYGPMQYGYSSVVSTWIESIFFVKDKKPFIEGDGLQSRDFCYIDDAVSAIVLALHHMTRFNGDSINIASGVSTSLVDLKKVIEKYSKKEILLDQKPPREGEIKYSVADIAKAKEILGYVPKTSLELGVKKTLRWFKSRKD
jgi:nucleoside-diphosphate-sugar epimerase